MDNHIFKILEILGPIAEASNPIVDYNDVLEKSNLSDAYLDDAIAFLKEENAIVFHPMMGPSKGVIQVNGRCKVLLDNAHPLPSPPSSTPDEKGIFQLMHPKVTTIAWSRYSTSHFADAVEAACKELNNEIKKIHQQVTGDEKDGQDLMMAAVGSSPSIVLDDLSTDSGRNRQDGYKFMLAGCIRAIRNPKAHANIDISKEECVRMLMLISHLFYTIDNRIVS